MNAKTDALAEREMTPSQTGKLTPPTVRENGRPTDGGIHSGESVQTKKEPPTCAGGSWSFMAPRVGFEPTTLRLTAGCSAVELPRNFFGALRFLGARKYYRHFNCRRNPLFQNFFSAADFGGCGLIRNLIRTLRFRYRSQPDMRRSSGQGIKWKLFTESWQRTRVFRIAEGDFGCRMLPERR